MIDQKKLQSLNDECNESLHKILELQKGLELLMRIIAYNIHEDDRLVYPELAGRMLERLNPDLFRVPAKDLQARGEDVVLSDPEEDAWAASRCTNDLIFTAAFADEVESECYPRTFEAFGPRSERPQKPNDEPTIEGPNDVIELARRMIAFEVKIERIVGELSDKLEDAAL